MELVTSEQRRTQNLVKHGRWSFFVKIVHGFKPFIIFTKNLHLDKVLNSPLQKQPLKRCSGK